MSKSGISCLKLAASAVLLGIALIPLMRTSTAAGRVPAPPVSGADLSNEERILAKYFDDLVAYDKECTQIGKSARLVSADLDQVQRKSDDLKGRLSTVQDAIREVVRKLKAANEWDELDTNLVARITDSRDKSFFQQNSFKKLLEDSANSFASHGNEISTPLDNLRRKVAQGTFSQSAEVQFVNASHHVPSAPFFAAGLKCLTANLRLGLLWRIGGKETTKTQNERICACSGGPSCATAAT